MLYGFLALEPSLILLDEPTAMIAPRLSREIYDVIKTLPDAGITVVLVDQNLRQCTMASDYMYVLDLGRVRAEGARASFGDGHPTARHDRRVARLPDRLSPIDS